MSIDLVKYYTHFCKPFDFYEYLLQKNIDHYKEQTIILNTLLLCH